MQLAYEFLQSALKYFFFTDIDVGKRFIFYILRFTFWPAQFTS